MSMVLIGSRALALRAQHALNRPPLDFDWLCTQAEYDSWMETESHKVNPTKTYELPEYHKMIVEGSTNCEFEIVQPGTSSELIYNLVNADKKSIETSFGLIPSLDILFTIKDSHKYKKFNNSSHGFWKTTCDWHMMKQLGASIKSEHETFHKLREAESYAAQRHPKLNVTKDNFFKDDNIQYVYEHDDIHLSVMHLDKPAYRFYMKDGSEVMSDKNKFFACSKEIQLYGSCEEAYTLALERAIIPDHANKMTPKQAFQFALAKVATSITSGFFRKFTFENIFDVIKLYNDNYVDKFYQDVKSGKVRFMKENVA